MLRWQKNKDNRMLAIVKKLDSFIVRLYEEHDFVLLPFGDGIGIVKISS